MIQAVSSFYPLTFKENQAPVQEPMRNQDKNVFSTLFNDALQKVNQDQIQADALSQELAVGRIENLHEVLVVSEQAALSLQLAVQVRNKVVEAYQEIMRMQV